MLANAEVGSDCRRANHFHIFQPQTVEPSREKYSTWSFASISDITGVVPARVRGVSRSSRTSVSECGGRDAALDETHLSRTAKSCGPDTRCWCQARWRFLSSPDRVRQTINPRATVTRRIRRRGERGISRKATLRRERRNAPSVPVCSCALS